MAKLPKTILGIQTAIIGGIVDDSAITPKIFSKNTKENDKRIPIAKFIPIPPRRFIEETATAIIVNINAETGTLYFLYKTSIFSCKSVEILG